MLNNNYVLRGDIHTHTMSQVAYIKEVFKEYFDKAITPCRIVELGTANGEFSEMIYTLRKNIDSNFDYFTMDIKTDFIDLSPELVFYQLDVFKNIDFIGGLIKENTLVLCDNGNKIEEVRQLTPYLRKNCVIMAHDYFKDAKTFLEENNWPSCEIMLSDVSDLGLELYYPEIMDRGLWLSMIKR